MPAKCFSLRISSPSWSFGISYSFCLSVCTEANSILWAQKALLGFVAVVVVLVFGGGFFFFWPKHTLFPGSQAPNTDASGMTPFYGHSFLQACVLSFPRIPLSPLSQQSAEGLRVFLPPRSFHSLQFHWIWGRLQSSSPSKNSGRRRPGPTRAMALGSHRLEGMQEGWLQDGSQPVDTGGYIKKTLEINTGWHISIRDPCTEHKSQCSHKQELTTFLQVKWSLEQGQWEVCWSSLRDASAYPWSPVHLIFAHTTHGVKFLISVIGSQGWLVAPFRVTSETCHFRSSLKAPPLGWSPQVES